MSLVKLIDKATKKVGNQTKLAQVLNKTQPDISDWKNGKIPCNTNNRIKLAQIIGFDLRHYLSLQVEELKKGTELEQETAIMLQAVIDAFPKSKEENLIDKNQKISEVKTKKPTKSKKSEIKTKEKNAKNWRKR